MPQGREKACRVTPNDVGGTVMKTLLVVFSVLLAACTTTRPAGPMKNTSTAATTTLSQNAEVGRIVADVWRSLKDTNRNMIPDYDLDNITLTLQTVTVETQSGNFELLIKIGGSRETTNSQQLVLKLVTPPADSNVAAADDYALLSNAIVAAAAAGRAARTATNDELALDTYGAEIGFTIKATKTGGGKLALAPVSIGADISEANTALHKVSVTFKRKASS